MFQNPTTDEICTLLGEVKTIAVVGLSENPARPSWRVASGMQGFGYRIIPVRPGASEVLGEKAYATLADVPKHIDIDIVDVFRAPQHVDAIVDECLHLGLKRLWFQVGVVNEAAAQRARAGGMTVVMDRCLWRDRSTLCEQS